MSEQTITKCYLKVVTIKYRNTYANKVTKGKGVFVSEYLNRKFKNSDVLHRGISEKVYCFIHNMNGRPKCKFCGGDINRKRALKGMTEGYQEYCSKSCINKHGDVRQKIGNNIIDKFLYHHEYPKFSTKKEELQFLVDTFPRHYQEILKIDRYHELMDYIKEHTKPLNDEFYTIATRVFWILHDITEFPKCDTCGVEIRDNVYSVQQGYIAMSNNRKNNFHIFCSQQCAQSHESVYKKAQQTKKEKYGDYSVIVNKMMDTCFKHYGKRTILTDTNIKSKAMDGIRNQIFIRLTNSDYVEPLFDKDFFLTHFKKHSDQNIEFNFKCKICNNTFKSYITNYSKRIIGKVNHIRYVKCPYCSHVDHVGYSVEEINLADNLKNNLPQCFKVIHRCKENNNLIKPYQIDILIKDVSTNNIILGIEYDGIYWHSEEFLISVGRDPKNYQLRKTLMMESNNIPLIHVWEDEWIKKPNYVIQKINDILENNIVFPQDDIIRLDRSEYSMPLIPKDYHIIKNEEPSSVLRTLRGDEQIKHVYNCGYFICERIRK